MRSRICPAFFALALILPVCHAAAADTQPGDACTVANQVMMTGGAESGGTRDFLICNGATWQSSMRITSGGSVGIGTTTPAAPLHVNGEAIIGMKALACAAGTAGAIRYNSSLKYIEFCNGTAWTQTAQVQGTTPPTAPAGSGYFVMSQTQWNGNLGGLSGADALCLTELKTTSTGWAGHAAADAAGLLTSGHVHAFLCSAGLGSCNNLTPLTTYAFANAGSSAYGGATFTTDSSGLGPNDAAIWSAENRFGGTFNYWTNRGGGSTCSSPSWGSSGGSSCGGPARACTGWTVGTSADVGYNGSSGYDNSLRYNAGIGAPCDSTYNLICFVNP